jgi:hypothetical protein
MEHIGWPRLAMVGGPIMIIGCKEWTICFGSARTLCMRLESRFEFEARLAVCAGGMLCRGRLGGATQWGG